MQITKNMRAGYQGKPDAMRELADYLTGPMNLSKGDKDINIYEKVVERKKGGSVKNKDSKRSCKKFAMGGVAKIRHGEATAQGLPKEFKKRPIRNMF